ncbi:hypothetical protein M3Y99_00028700 [Aphelenchoides fujianensis]|nr:hypothetical protein M3Y99_00028700 [Aphelenchoides fujianensis]
MPQQNPLEEFRFNEETKLRKKLAALNRDNPVDYFNGVNRILDELDDQKRELEAEEKIRVEKLRKAREFCVEIRKELEAIREHVLEERENYEANRQSMLKRLEEKAPELLRRAQELAKDRSRLEQLKFVKFFDETQRKIDNAINRQEYALLLEAYGELNVEDEKIPTECRKGFKKRMNALNESLIADLRAQLLGTFEKIRFPFDDSVDYRALRSPLETAALILRCLREVEQKCGRDEYETIQIVTDLFEKRFVFHFYGDKPTNNPAKPEWMFSQVLTWIGANSEFFEVHVQRLFDEWGLNEPADEFFAECLVKRVVEKVRSLLDQESFVSNRQQFAHLLDETIAFGNEIQSMFGQQTDIPEVIALFLEPRIFDEWIELEKDAISVGVDEILADPQAFRSRFEGANDIDPLMVPNFADTFCLLMQSMSERYLSFRDSRLRSQFLKHQLLIVDEFLSRIARIFHETESVWREPYAQLMNAVWYIAIVLDEWSSEESFIELNAVENGPAALARHSADLYRHEWRKRARILVAAFRESVDHQLREYQNEKWFQMNHQTPVDVSASLSPFLRKILERIEWLRENVSEDSRLVVFKLVNEEIWSSFSTEAIGTTPFTNRGAAQMLFDVQQGLIPLLQHAFKPTMKTIQADSGLKHFDCTKNAKCKEVINTLKLLALPSGTAILLKDEIARIPESMVGEKLAPLAIEDIGRELILHLFEQRVDMHSLT